MRRLLALTALLTVVVGWSSLVPGGAQASQMCSTTCSGGVTLKCCVSTGSCTSSPGQIECNGVVHTCAEWQAGAAAVDNCVNNCYATYDACIVPCRTFTCIGNCTRARNTCENNCYLSGPQTNWGC